MKTTLNSAFLFTLIILVGILSYLIFKPFLIALFLAFVLSQLFKKWYKEINKKFGNRPSLASFSLCIILFFILAIPFFITATLVAKETTDLYQNVQKVNWQEKIEKVAEIPMVKNLGFDLKTFNVQNFILGDSEKIANNTKDFGNLFFSIVKKTYQGTSSFIFMTFVTFFSLYYLFKDGDKMIKKVMQLSPLKDKEEGKLLENFVSVSKATLRGSLVIAIIQGLLTALVFAISGVPSPVLWGSITIVVSLIPLLGAALVWLPAGLIMIFSGNVWQGVTILIFGALIISMIDNFLRPKLVGNETSLHPMLVFFSTIGGIALFGIIGILLGPIIIVLFISLLDIYQSEFKTELKKING